jgi:hypothetical protein
MTATTTARSERRCGACERPLFVKLTLKADGALARALYCDSCDRARDVTSNLARRAALVAARSVA